MNMDQTTPTINPQASVPPSAAEALGADTPVMKQFREWEADFNRIEGLGAAISDEEIRPHYRRHDAMIERLLALRCETPADFAAKLVGATMDGVLDLGDTAAGRALMAEARALIGGSQ